MHRPAVMIMIVFLATMLLTGSRAVLGWDIAYEADVLPNDPSLGPGIWSVDDTRGYYSDTTAQGGQLHMVDNRTDKTVIFSREGLSLPAGTDVTVEARVRVVSITPAYPGGPAVWFGGGGAFVSLFPDGMETQYGRANDHPWYPVDLTEFHTVRIAVNGAEHRFRVWVDSIEAFDGPPAGVQAGGVFFRGTYGMGAGFDTYWDYVRYSKEYLPIPEPSSLLALAAGIGGIGLGFVRRRRC